MLAFEPQVDRQTEEEGVDLFSILMPIARRWRFLAGMTLVFALLTVLGSLLVTTRYSAHATFLLDTQDPGNNGGSGFNIVFGRQADPTVSLLFSNTVTDAVVTKADLQALETDRKRQDPVTLRNEVRSELNAVRTPDGLYIVTIADKNPERAITIANGYLAALQYMNDKMNFDAAAHSREFYESQVQSERVLLEKAEAELTAAQQRTGLLQPQNQTGIALGTIAALKGQITGLEVELASALQGATEQNPAVVRLRTQIAALQAKETALQHSLQSVNRASVPVQNLELQRLQRNVSYHEGLVSSLGAQFERARIQETYTSGRVRVVDRAAPPAQKTLPNRILLGASGAIVGLFLGLVIVAVAHWRAALSANPLNREKMVRLRSALSGDARA